MNNMQKSKELKGVWLQINENCNGALKKTLWSLNSLICRVNVKKESSLKIRYAGVKDKQDSRKNRTNHERVVKIQWF